jgi:hypothetical protein
MNCNKASRGIDFEQDIIEGYLEVNIEEGIKALPLLSEAKEMVISGFQFMSPFFEMH